MSLVKAREAEAREIAAAAAKFRHDAKEGQAMRNVVPRLGVNMILVNGTDEGCAAARPGRDLATFMPGQGRLVYIAGHRTTYLAPFSQIQTIRRGDSITIEKPYGTFLYRATGHLIVPAHDLSVLRPRQHELLALHGVQPALLRHAALHRVRASRRRAAEKRAAGLGARARRSGCGALRR